MNKNFIIIGHLNINSVCNKFEELESLTSGNVDIICISEIKILLVLSSYAIHYGRLFQTLQT